MRFVKTLFVVLAAVCSIAVAREARAQQPDLYVSCVKCHALPMLQARAQMEGHGFPYPPAPEYACTDCHDTWNHEQNPQPSGYMLWRAWSGPGSPLANACLSCHPSLPPGHHAYDVFPYFDATPPSNPPLLPQGPTSILPLFTSFGAPDQYNGGLVCSTCHNPHNPSYPVNGSSKFLRIGGMENTGPLCNYCHTGTPPTTGADLFIPSDSDSVRFALTPGGDLEIEVTVRNRGNDWPGYASGMVYWDDGSGVHYPVGPLSLNFPPPPGGEAVAFAFWAPPPEWTYGEGFFVFELSPQPLLGSPYPIEFVRSMDIPPKPTNLRVTNVGVGEVYLAWDPPPVPSGPLNWSVYRDGVKITTAPVWMPSYIDSGLAPETPHVYTVVAVGINGGLPSQQSDPVGATTVAGMVLRVPQDYPTIQAAINASSFMTSIHVAPGTYTEPLNLSNKYGITIKGLDANGCILDYSGGPSIAIDLGYSTTQPGNTLSGFTIRNGAIMAGPGAVVSRCVIKIDNMNPGPAVMGGGLVAQCVFDTGARPAFHIFPDRFLTSVNSIYLGSQPFEYYAPPASAALLLNNNFPSWFEWWQFPGSGNFWDPPVFAAPGPPAEYFPAASPTFDRGLMLGTPFLGAAPDVGVFEFGQSYTPQPPANLVATFVATPLRHIELTWTPSIDAPARVPEYRIYRSTTDPAFPPGLEIPPYATVPAGTTFFSDYDVPAGTIYYYQVRAYAFPSGLPPEYELLSAPTNTASAGDSNNPPVAVDDFATTRENQPVSIVVLANDSDPDGDVFHILDVGYPQHGSASLNPDETIEYTPAPGFSGSDSFSYTVLDVRGGSATAYVYVTVVPNRPPVAANDTYSTPEDIGLSVPAPGVLGNDTDPDGDALEALLLTGPAHGTLTLNLDGSFVYVPAANFHGPDFFTYLAGDRQAVSEAATVTIIVPPVNDQPVASGQTVTTAEDTAVPVTLAAADVDGDVLIYVVVPPAKGTLSGVAPNLTYTPNANFNGADFFSFFADDGQEYSAIATVTITVTPVNDPPVFVKGANQKVNNNAGTQIVAGWATGIGDGDPEVSQSLMFDFTNDNPALFAVQPVILLDGELIYTPAANAGGVATVTVRLTDDFSAGGPAITTPAQTFTITVNRPPVAMEQWITTTRNTPLAVTLNAWDMDGDALTYTVASGPAHGSLLGIAPNLTYTPALGYTGPDSFSFTANDGQATSAPATVTITVNAPPVANAGPDQTGNIGQVLTFSAAASYDPDGTIVTDYQWVWGDSTAGSFGTVTATHSYANPGTYTVTLTVFDNDGATATDSLTVTVNAPPAALSQTVTTGEDTAFAVTLAATDADGDALTYAVTTAPVHGTLSGTAPNLTYTPAANYNGPDSFTFTANDGTVDSNTATVSITVTPVNDPPVAMADAYGWVEDGGAFTPSAPGLLINDTDADGDALSAVLDSDPSHGTVTVNANGSFSYTPAANFNGDDSFTYHATDGLSNSAVVTVSMHVNYVNDPPVPASQSITTAEDTAVAVTLFANDVDGDALTYAVVTGPAHGTLSGTAPNLSYTPAANYNGPDSFTFNANDGTIGSNVATVLITVTAVNDLPTANAGADQTGNIGQVLSFSGAASTDSDGSIASYSWNWGDGTAAGSGVSATHAYATAGSKTVTLTVTDNNGATATDTLIVTVNAVNLALNKTATASTSRSGYPPANAVDGSTSTSWMSSKTGGTQWLKVDLGASTSISNVKVRWQSGYHAKSFKVETSTNGTSWTTRHSTTGGAGGTTDVVFTAASARHVRVSCTKANNSSYYGILELEVYQ